MGERFVRIGKAGITALLAGSLAFGSGTSAISLIARNRLPSLALKAKPNEPIALATLADRMLVDAKDIAQIKESANLARASLKGQALNPRALRVLGFAENTIGNNVVSAKLIRTSAKMSRRNLGTHLWLIEQAIRDNDIEGALRQYHLALTTKRESKDVLFPILATAITNPEVANELVPYVKRRAYWIPSFTTFAAGGHDSIRPLADIIIHAGGLEESQSNEQILSRLVTKLLDHGEFERAAGVFSTIDDAPIALITSPSINGASLDQKHIGYAWSLSSDPSRGAEGRLVKEGASLVAYTSSGKAGVVASKALLLPAGNYTLRVDYGELKLGSKSAVQWRVRCGGAEKEALIAKGAVPSENFEPSRLTFSVATSCKGQFLELYVDGGDGQQGAEIVVNAVEVVKG